MYCVTPRTGMQTSLSRSTGIPTKQHLVIRALRRLDAAHAHRADNGGDHAEAVDGAGANGIGDGRRDCALD
jgi:hypothetical protein